jgi:APA family basic amino acid/polyamine antiporter
VLGLWFGLAVTLGNTIGAGIFRAPGEVAAHLPDAGLFLAAWIVGGLYALLGAIQLSELGATLRQSGGQYVFARHVLGEYAGFVVGWTDWLSTCGSTALVAVVLGEFARTLLPTIAGGAIAAAATLGFAVVQWRGIRSGSRVQNATSALKALVFAVLIAAAFAAGPAAAAATPTAAAVPQGLALAAAFILALQSVIYTYDGWSAIIYFSEEVRDPGRDIPRSAIGGVLLVLLVYLLVNVAFLYVMPLPAIAAEDFVAAAVARVIFGQYGDVAFAAMTVVSMLSAINALELMSTRVLFAMGRDGLIPARAATVNSGGTPTAALIVSTAAAVLFIVLGRTFERLVTVLAFFFVANYTLSFASVFVLRRREPDRPRPYRAWGYPWTTALALGGSVAFLAGAVASDTSTSIQALFLLAASYPLYRLTRTARRV